MLKYSCSILFLLAGLSACTKKLSNGSSDFAVTAQRTSLNAGDTARFSFAGNPDIITFYSGEPGKRFEFKDRVQAEGLPVVNFSTVRANGVQQNTLLLMISSDFKGVVRGDTNSTKANIAAATWEDITSRATLALSGTTAVPSGDIELTDFAEAGKPVYIAFKYIAEAGSIQPKWTISNFTVKNNLSDGTSYTIANMNTSSTPYTNYGVNTFSPGFASYTLQNNFNWSVSTTSMVITGATSVGAAGAPAEAWLFIGPINLRKVTPDAGLVIKNGGQNMADLNFYTFYNTPGNYKATFVGGRVSIEETSVTPHNIDISVQ
ncbi:DUF5017 domain-containing protein [Pseudobacter ginsenosidimutans]|uniref:Uncharacterized protein DUF5017 n=1 Tax=Pseudobacter ginsenosidimutans TaxID=661488 RepID=A0A4Q7MT82_9BACT|nr:DUF5017 domain-containing protein [Pseudobacter ginsenosidimutans]QEC41509.1 DUF5017 domain-containing protein [Pseudobacter ginsenosidimutans]RZS71708.1 uncharacterized protein DUF5017 [Pseudobacter ginsenosidimutans]